MLGVQQFQFFGVDLNIIVISLVRNIKRLKGKNIIHEKTQIIFVTLILIIYQFTLLFKL